jgi:aspartyl-tRNA(Asn)/glutamyl-tRNA(Gln) amidotransferase subunit A
MMADLELCYMSAVEARNRIRDRVLSPVDLAKASIQRIEELNPKLNAYCTVADGVMKEAREAERTVMKGEELGPLHGVPVSIKDLFLTKGLKTTFGSRIYERFVPTEDEIVVERLKAAGAIVLGKTTTSEFGHKAVTDSPLLSVTRNPWNAELTPGGSSCGGAVSVSCGMGPLAIGSNAGGSIRAPPSFCGIFGLKPSRGRVPLYPVSPGWKTLTHALVHLGPLARTVEDAALAMEAIAGPDNRDPLTLSMDKDSFLEELTAGIRGLKVAWCPNHGNTIVDKQVLTITQEAALRFSELGCTVEEVRLEFSPIHEAYTAVFAASCAAALDERVEEWKDRLDRGLVRLTEIGLEMKASDCVGARNQWYHLWETLRTVFQQYDLLLTPTLPLPSFPTGVDWPGEINGREVPPLAFLAFTYPFNITGQPAATVPCGSSEDNLPGGLQIIGCHFHDGTALRATAAFEEAFPWACMKPPL